MHESAQKVEEKKSDQIESHEHVSSQKTKKDKGFPKVAVIGVLVLVIGAGIFFSTSFILNGRGGGFGNKPSPTDKLSSVRKIEPTPTLAPLPDNVLQTLTAECYNKFKPQYDAKKPYLTIYAMDTLDSNEFSDLPKEYQTGLAAINQLVEALSPGLHQTAEQAKPQFIAAAQIQIDLLTCYNKNLTNYPKHKERVQTLLTRANQNLSEIEKLDFSNLTKGNLPSKSVISIPAGQTQTYRFRTFCIDGSRGGPNQGQEYILAGLTDSLADRKGLCSYLKQAQAGKKLTRLQYSIWSLEGNTESGFDDSFKPMPTMAYSKDTDGSTVSLMDAFQKQEIKLKAFSPGTYSSLDVSITNDTTSDLSLDTSCVYFAPINSTQSLSKQPRSSNLANSGSKIKAAYLNLSRKLAKASTDTSRVMGIADDPTTTPTATPEAILSLPPFVDDIQRLGMAGVSTKIPDFIDLTSPADLTGQSKSF